MSDIPFLFEKHLKTFGGKQGFYTRTADQVQIGEEKLAPFLIEIGDLYSDFKIDGIIGNDLLKMFQITINYKKEILNLLKQ